MANGHGGYRQPSHPAPVSGPGASSRRTDGGPQAVSELPNAKYGEAQAFRDAQQAAPMNSSGGGVQGPQGGGGGMPDLSGIVPMGAPSQNPGENVLSGVSGGPGGGPSTGPPAPVLDKAQADRLRSYMPVLVMLASQEDSDPQTRQFVRQLRGELG